MQQLPVPCKQNEQTSSKTAGGNWYAMLKLIKQQTDTVIGYRKLLAY